MTHQHFWSVIKSGNNTGVKNLLDFRCVRWLWDWKKKARLLKRFFLLSWRQFCLLEILRWSTVHNKEWLTWEKSTLFDRMQTLLQKKKLNVLTILAFHKKCFYFFLFYFIKSGEIRTYAAHSTCYIPCFNATDGERMKSLEMKLQLHWQ